MSQSYAIANLKWALRKYTEHLPHERYWPPAFRDELAQTLLEVGGDVTSRALMISRASGPKVASMAADIVQPITDMMHLSVVTTQMGALILIKACIKAWEELTELYKETSIGEKLVNMALKGNFKKEHDELSFQMLEDAERLNEMRLPRVYTVPQTTSDEPLAVSPRKKSSAAPVAIGVALLVGWLTFRKS